MVKIEAGIESPHAKGPVQELEKLISDLSFVHGYIEAQAAIDPKARVARGDSAKLQEIKDGKAADLLSLREELSQRRDDLDLSEALGIWGQSPDARGERGSRGQGFNAGVIHYFAYRAAEGNKAKRFKGSGSPTIQGFIDISIYLKSLIDQPDPKLNAAVQVSAQVQDAQGQKRLMLLTQANWLIVGFQRTGDSMKVISAGSYETPRRFKGIIKKELEGSVNEDSRLNKLGEGRTLVQ